MAAAADRFAMRVEEDRIEFVEPMALEQLRETQPQPLDSKRRRHLSDEAPRIGKSELHRDSPLPFEVRAIMRTLQRLLDHPLAAFERLLGLEQRRNLDLIFHSKQPRIVERGQQREAGLRFG